jgi:plastocyanin
MSDAHPIKLSTANGGTDAVLEVNGGVCGHKEDMNVTFTVPSGFKKQNFGYEVKKGGINAGGNVTWVNDNPHDATIHIHGWADPASSVRIRVFDVMGISE